MAKIYLEKNSDKKRKNTVQDIVPSPRRTPRSIPVKRLRIEDDIPEEPTPLVHKTYSAHRASARFEEEEVTINDTEVVQNDREVPKIIRHERIERTDSINERPQKRKRRFPSLLLTFFIVFVGVAVIAIALSLLYSKAAVTITPKVAHFEINGTFTARRVASQSTSQGPSELVYDVLTQTGSDHQSVAATDGPVTQTTSKGTITLYNAQTIQQKIVAGTRLANAADLIYRTSATVTIPAAKNVAGKLTPGIVSVAVIADKAGAEYDMSINDTSGNFTVVAYKGTPKYSTVYAKLKTAITGGFSGSKKIISPTVQKAAVTALQDSLKTQLLVEVKSKVPAGYILYDKAVTIDYVMPTPTATDKATADIKVNGTLSGIIFKKDMLIKSIAAKELDKFPSPTYDIEGMEDLAFTFINSKDFSFAKASPFIFSLKGPITLVGTLSQEALKNELKGTYLKQSNLIFAHYPAIANAYALITPFWMRSFPNSADKISVEVKR